MELNRQHKWNKCGGFFQIHFSLVNCMNFSPILVWNFKLKVQLMVVKKYHLLIRSHHLTHYIIIPPTDTTVTYTLFVTKRAGGTPVLWLRRQISRHTPDRTSPHPPHFLRAPLALRFEVKQVSNRNTSREVEHKPAIYLETDNFR